MINRVKAITRWSINNPKKAIWANVALALFFVALVALPLIWSSLPLNKVKIDTDPENMLSAHESVRVFHNDMKKTFGLYDMVVLGVVNKENPQGVFNAESLSKIYELSSYAEGLEGVISKEMISPATVDSIEASQKGVVNFHWLMPGPVSTDKEGLEIYAQASRIPFLNGTLVSSDGKALALYIPIKSKDLSYKVAAALKEKAKELDIRDEVHITGLPVAQDQFGVEMFKQMAISAPLAMLFIFILMYFFFKNVRLIISPMVVAVLSVMVTMGLLIATGNTVHIMSSMIPIFIMPIAVLDSVHILSDFFDTYHNFKDKRKAITHVMDTLFTPMLYTSVTTVVGFASLASAPIPPVQIFGLFVALGVTFAWISTVTFIPAFVMLMKDESLENFGLKQGQHDTSFTANLLHGFGEAVYRYYKPVLVIAVLLIGAAFYGIKHIVINDNPVKWFAPSHEIRIADKALNERFAGTYTAYLALDANITDKDIQKFANQEGIPSEEIKGSNRKEIIDNLWTYADEQEDPDLWYSKIENLEKDLSVFKNPEALAYIEKLQNALMQTGIVGKSNSIADIIKTVHRDLYEGDPQEFKLPDTTAGVAQTLITYQNSHRPNDLWHFVTPQSDKANIWVQLKSGDNKDMSKVVKAVDAFVAANPAPFNIKTRWFGMTYINVIWQDKMVTGMLRSFLGSFFIVMLLMTFLFRSIAWGALSMLPLTITIGVIYGIIGFVGKDYDMPIAVLSSLSLGLAVDYAIHFLARSRELVKEHGSWRQSLRPLFGEPARAIFRNVIVISIGFVPLILAPLVPYQTVGFFISAILFLAGAVTLALLPAAITMFEKYLFKPYNGKMSLATKIGIVVLIVASVVANF